MRSRTSGRVRDVQASERRLHISMSQQLRFEVTDELAEHKTPLLALLFVQLGIATKTMSISGSLGVASSTALLEMVADNTF